jgi:hypothetical protein
LASQRPISKEKAVRPCADVVAFAGIPLRYLPQAPASAPQVICYVAGPEFGQVPDKTTAEYWGVGVMYLPSTMSADVVGDLNAIGNGALAVDIFFNRKPVSVDPNATQERDGYVAVDINGHLGGIARPTAKYVTLQWFEGSLKVMVAGNFPPQGMIQFARSLASGVPTIS